MCLAIPGRILRIFGEEPEARLAEVDFDGSLRTVRLLFVPEVRAGDYVLAHAGFATQRVDAEDALEAQRLARTLREAPLP